MTKNTASGLTHKHQTRLERLARDKHSSLLRTFVNYSRKSYTTPVQEENFTLFLSPLSTLVIMAVIKATLDANIQTISLNSQTFLSLF